MRISLVAGLPGSGKTHLLNEMAEQGAFIVDDITSLDDLPDASVEWIAISDVNFCLKSVRTIAEAELRDRFPAAVMEWTFFENDPDACRANAKARNDGRNVRPDIDALSSKYSIPAGANVLPVFGADHRGVPIR